MDQPDATVEPGKSTHFAFVQTPGGNEPSIAGTMTWEVGDPSTETWDLAWENPTGQKNTATAKLQPGSTGLHSLAQAGQGDENVPVTFTLSGGGGGGTGPVTAKEASCDVTLINNTQQPLSLSDRQTPSGAFSSDPPTTIAAGQTVKFGYASGPNSPGKGAIGSVTYDIGADGAASWKMSWTNPIAGRTRWRRAPIRRAPGSSRR